MVAFIRGKYLSDIMDQPLALAKTCDGLPASAPFLASDATAGKFARIVLTGMGSSLHALYPLYLALTDLGLPCVHVETAELCLQLPKLLHGNVLVIAVSQSGRSAEIVDLLNLLGKNTRLLAVTNNAESPLAVRADEVLLIRAGEEATVSCKTYVCTLLILEWLAAAFREGDLSLVRCELEQAASVVQEYLQSADAHIAELVNIAAKTVQTYFVGRGPSLATTLTAGLITKEATRLPAEGMSSAAFRHGPLEVVSSEVLVAVFMGEGQSRILNERLAADIRAAGGQAYSVGPNSALESFTIRQTSGRLRPILEILPVQLLTVAIAAERREEAGKFRLASKVTIVS